MDASAIDFSRCDMDGATLCSCAPEELRLVFGPLGDQLYSQLWDMSECRGGVPLSRAGPGGGPLSPSLGQQGCREAPEPQAGGRGQREPCRRVALSACSLSASSFPDELSWIIDLLEKDSASFQETLGDPGPTGESTPSLCPLSQTRPGWEGHRVTTALVTSPEPPLPLLDQGSAFGQESSPYHAGGSSSSTVGEGPVLGCSRPPPLSPSPWLSGPTPWEGPELAGASAESCVAHSTPPPGTGSSQSPRCSDSGGSDLDLDPGDSRLLCSGQCGCPAGSAGIQRAVQGLPCTLPASDLPPPAEGYADHKKGEPKHGKRKRGRPRKLGREPRDCLEGRKSKHGGRPSKAGGRRGGWGDPPVPFVWPHRARPRGLTAEPGGRS